MSEKKELSRELSLFHITMMGMGMMIGAGVFIGIGNVIRIAGPGGVLLTFGLNGLIALFSAMSYAELSSAIPRAGGAYNFTRIGFGRGMSFLAGWMEWFASSVAGSIYGLTFAIYIVYFCNQLGLLGWVPFSHTLLEKIIAGGVVLFFIYINYRGVSETGKIGAFFTLGQTITLLFVGAVGIVMAIKDPERLSNFDPFLPCGWGKLLVTMGFTYVAFEGFEVIAQAGDEVINPRSNLPKAILFSLFITVTIYLILAFTTIVSIKQTGDTAVWQTIGSFRERGFGFAISKLIPYGGFLITIAVIFSSTSALNATIYSATRASYALGRDKMLPSFFAHISERRKTPVVALAGTSLIILIIALFLPTIDVASSASIMFLFLFFLVNICVIKIRRSMSDELQYGFIMPFFPFLPLIAIVLQIVLAVWLVHMSLIAWIIAPCWIIAGILVYFLYAKSHVSPSPDEIVTLEEEITTDEAAITKVLIPVSNPETVYSLVWMTYQLCRNTNAKIELLHMVPVPDQVPLSDAHKFVDAGNEALFEAMVYLAPTFPITTTIRYCRNIARGIVSACREKKSSLLIMGWHGKSYKKEFIFGSTVDPVIEKAPCDIIMLKNCQKQQFKRILVPFSGGPNSTLAIETAANLCYEKDGEIIVFTVRLPGKQTVDVDAVLQEKVSNSIRSSKKIITKYNVSKNIIQTILHESKEYDLVVIGASNESIFHQIFLGSIPEEIARRCQKPVIMVKKNQGIRSFLKKWI
ncbi:amino acid permease [Chlamydiota bacterium]